MINNMMLKNGMPCVVCRQSNHTPHLEALKRIETFLCNHGYVDDKQGTYGRKEKELSSAISMWASEKCSYGLNCDKLSRANNQMERLAGKVSPAIINYLNDGGNKHELLEYFRGYFPAGYTYIDRNFNIS